MEHEKSIIVREECLHLHMKLKGVSGCLLIVQEVWEWK